MNGIDGVGAGWLDWPQVLLGVLALAVVVALVTVAATTTAAFGPFNPSWDGTSDLREQVDDDSTAEGDLIRETARYDEIDSDGSVAFVVAPDDSYEGEDRERLRQFVHSGGTLVVFENFETEGNELLADVNAEARIDGQMLRDEQSHYRGPTMPIATTTGDHSYTDGVDQLTLNYASAIDPGEATVLVASSEYGYLVETPTDELDDETSLDTHPVATVEDVGDGEVVVVSDPSLVVNAMLAEPDNAVFVENLYDDADRVVIDISHADDVPPLTAAVLVIREMPFVQAITGLAAVGLIAVLSRWRARPGVRRVRKWAPGVRTHADDFDHEAKSPGLSKSQRIAYLRQHHPDWDDDRIERILTTTTSIERDRDE